MSHINKYMRCDEHSTCTAGFIPAARVGSSVCHMSCRSHTRILWLVRAAKAKQGPAVMDLKPRTPKGTVAGRLPSAAFSLKLTGFFLGVSTDISQAMAEADVRLTSVSKEWTAPPHQRTIYTSRLHPLFLYSFSHEASSV